jgi:alkylation response protein AidB-like acyl-CoA dehydrogenase
VSVAAEHPLAAEARRLAEELLEPAAAEVDASEVPRGHLEALGAAGLLGLAAPTAVGGSAASPPVARAVAEALAGADASTWFVQAQHHSPVRMLAAHPSAASDHYLPRLARGELVAGIAFSHLRRFPQRPLTATRTRNGWRLDGTAPWYTGWGLNDVAFVAGVTETDDVVFGVVPAREVGGVTVTARLRTAALGAARTVVLSLEAVQVDDDHVALVLPHERWLADDRVSSANANPAIFGVAGSAVRLLEQAGQGRDEPATRRAAAVFAERLTEIRQRCYSAADDPDTPVDLRLALRAEALELLVAATSALVAANSGPAMALGAPAQRKAREALFLLVQAQTAAGRAATLERWAASAGRSAAARA